MKEWENKIVTRRREKREKKRQKKKTKNAICGTNRVRRFTSLKRKKKGEREKRGRGVQEKSELFLLDKFLTWTFCSLCNTYKRGCQCCFAFKEASYVHLRSVEYRLHISLANVCLHKNTYMYTYMYTFREYRTTKKKKLRSSSNNKQKLNMHLRVGKKKKHKKRKQYKPRHANTGRELQKRERKGKE